MTREQQPTPATRRATPDEPWAELRRFTAARIALPRSGASLGFPVLAVASAAQDRQHYLMRPDLGRRLSDDAAALLASHAGSGFDAAVVIADGLSAGAVATHAEPVLAQVLPRLAGIGWRIAPLVVARLGRVAIG